MADSSSVKQIQRLEALSNVCQAQIVVMNAQLEFSSAKISKQRGLMKQVAGQMKRTVVMLRFQ
jgi:hypothetical protein